MRKFKFENIEEFDSVYEIFPLLAEDKRGYIIKDYHEEVFKDNGLELPLKEVFYTKSKKGVIRAIHFQSVKPQAKLVRCISGKIFDVIVDLRIDSPTYKKWKGFFLDESSQELYIPHGFGHGYLVLEDSIVSYKCDEKFYGEYDTGICWDDKDINIKWPLEEVSELILSDKDKNLQTLQEYEMNKNVFKMNIDKGIM